MYRSEIRRAKNGAHFQIMPDGRARFVSGASPEYLAKIRKRPRKPAISKEFKKMLSVYRHALVKKAKEQAQKGGRFYVDVPRLKQLMLKNGVPSRALQGAGFMDFLKGAWREITSIPKYFNTGMKTIFGPAANIVKNGMARTLDVVAPGTGVVAQTLMGDGIKMKASRGGRAVRKTVTKRKTATKRRTATKRKN